MSQLDKFYRYIRPIYTVSVSWYDTFISKPFLVKFYTAYFTGRRKVKKTILIMLAQYTKIITRGCIREFFLPSYFWIYTAHPIHSLKIHSFYRYMHGYTNDIVFFNGVYKYISNLSQRSWFLLTISIFILNFAINVL